MITVPPNNNNNKYKEGEIYLYAIEVELGRAVALADAGAEDTTGIQPGRGARGTESLVHNLQGKKGRVHVRV